jgi:hypothetical protein
LHGDWWKSSPSEYVFLRRFPSVTTHSTSSNLQFVHGMPLSTTSLRPPVSHHSRRVHMAVSTSPGRESLPTNLATTAAVASFGSPSLHSPTSGG